jgi:hypothetical protein
MSLPGIGPKTASWIARNWLDADDVAILDIHIMRVGQVIGLFPLEQTVERHYMALEERFLRFAELLDVRASELDAIIWRDGVVTGHRKAVDPSLGSARRIQTVCAPQTASSTNHVGVLNAVRTPTQQRKSGAEQARGWLQQLGELILRRDSQGAKRQIQHFSDDRHVAEHHARVAPNEAVGVLVLCGSPAWLCNQCQQKTATSRQHLFSSAQTSPRWA